MSETTTINPLFTTEFGTPFNTIPFDKITLEHFKPAFDEALKEGKADIEAIKKNTASPNFENTFEALERAGSKLSLISSIFFNLNSAETSDEMQTLAQEISPLLTAYSNDITMDAELFKRIEEAKENTNENDLTVEQQRLFEKTYKGFVRSGAKLAEDKKNKLKEINTQLATLGLTFGQNVLKDTNIFKLLITDKKDLAGLPESAIEAAEHLAEEKGEKGWLFTLDYPSYIPFMTYADNRSLREQMYRAFGAKGFQNNENNNEKVVKEIVELKRRRAQLLGYDTHATFTLEERMAENPSKVYELLDDLLIKAKPVAEKELTQVAELAKEDNIDELQRWDFSYYSEKLKHKLFNYNEEDLKPYFKLENVIDGVFQTASKLFGITFNKREDIPTYHKDVMTYEVLDEEGCHLAVFYADFFPREGKRAGAWMTSFKGQNKYDGYNHRPHVSIVCNFTKPTKTKPSLLTFNEVTTLFHEFGHALHGMLANGYYESLSGTSVYWDFVELPSQILENWCYEQECLSLFAKHYETEELIPMELVKKIKDSSNFLSGYQTVRQVSFGKLDMAWHNVKDSIEDSVWDYEEKAMKETEIFPKVDGVIMSCSFSHIFQGGYSAGYYSYKWAEVLDADAFEQFKKNGVFDKDTASSFRKNILEKGGSEHPMVLYKRFKGQEPTVDALLKRSGLI